MSPNMRGKSSSHRWSQKSWPRPLCTARQEKWQHWWREGSIYWKSNTSRPFGISFWYTDRAEYPVFMGSRQMTWSLLQWRWSLLMERGTWRRIQEQQLGVSHRNRPAVYAQLCRELSFLNIHKFNRLKRLLRHAGSAKDIHVQPWKEVFL